MISQLLTKETIQVAHCIGNMRREFGPVETLVVQPATKYVGNLERSSDGNHNGCRQGQELEVAQLVFDIQVEDIIDDDAEISNLPRITARPNSKVVLKVKGHFCPRFVVPIPVNICINDSVLQLTTELFLIEQVSRCLELGVITYCAAAMR